jgi:hypothetical protein
VKFSTFFKNELFDPEREVTAGELLQFKLFELFIVVYVLLYSWSWGLYTQKFNEEVILSLGLANYIDISLFFDHYLSIIIAIAISILVLTTFFRVGNRWFYLIVMVLFHLQYVIRYSQGEIPHSQNLVGLSVLILAVGAIFFPTGKFFPRFVFGGVIFFIGLGYTSAFFSKLIGTGFHWFYGEHLWLWISEKSIDILSREGVYGTNLLQKLALQHVSVASLILLTGWFIELIGFTLWFKKWRPYTITLLIGMHIGITLTMNIRFDAFVMQLILVGYPWYKMIRIDSDRFHKHLVRLTLFKRPLVSGL